MERNFKIKEFCISKIIVKINKNPIIKLIINLIKKTTPKHKQLNSPNHYPINNDIISASTPHKHVLISSGNKHN